MGGSLLVLRVFLSVLCVLFLSALFYNCCSFPVATSQRAEKHERRDADQVADVRNRRARIFLPINPLKMAKTNNTRFGRSENALG